MKHISIKIKEEEKVRYNLSNREYIVLIKSKTHKKTRKILEEMGYILDSYEKEEDEKYGSIEIIKETERYATKEEYLEWLDIMKDKIENKYNPDKIKLLKNKEITILHPGEPTFKKYYDCENSVCKYGNDLCLMEKQKIHDPNMWSLDSKTVCESCCLVNTDIPPKYTISPSTKYLAGCGTDERALSFGGEKIKKVD